MMMKTTTTTINRVETRGQKRARLEETVTINVDDSVTPPLPVTSVSPSPSNEQHTRSRQTEYGDSEYYADTYRHLLDLEVRRMAQRRPPHPSETTRETKMAWLLDVTERLPGHTLVAFKAVDYMDRCSSELYYYTEFRPSLLWQSKLLAASTLLASKMESNEDSIELYDLVENLPGKSIYTRDVIATESEVINALKFELETATVPQFLDVYAERWLWPLQLESCTRTLAGFLCDQTLGRAEFYEFRPSLVALACLYLASKHTTGKGKVEPVEELALLMEPFHSKSDFSKCAQHLEHLRTQKKGS